MAWVLRTETSQSSSKFWPAFLGSVRTEERACAVTVQDHSNNLSYVAVPAIGWCIVMAVLFVLLAGARATPRSEPTNSSIDAGRQQYPVARKPRPTCPRSATSPFSMRKPLATWMTISGRPRPSRRKSPPRPTSPTPSAMSTGNRRVCQRALQVTGVGMAYPTICGSGNRPLAAKTFPELASKIRPTSGAPVGRSRVQRGREAHFAGWMAKSQTWTLSFPAVYSINAYSPAGSGSFAQIL